LELIGVDNPPPLRKLLGEDTTLYVATTGQHLFLACGHRALAAVERSLPAQETQAAPLRMSLQLGAVLTAIARSTSTQETVPVLTLAALSLQASDDRLLLTTQTDKESLRARLELREGVLRAGALGLSLASQRMLRERSDNGKGDD
jgi:hypothetical protein